MADVVLRMATAWCRSCKVYWWRCGQCGWGIITTDVSYYVAKTINHVLEHLMTAKCRGAL